MSKFAGLAFLITAAVMLQSCSASTTSSTPVFTGSVSLKLYDAPIVIGAYTVVQVSVNYDGAYIHRTNDAVDTWITVISNAGTIANLLDLTSNAPATLGLATVPADKYTQIRIDVSTNGHFVVWTTNGITNTNVLALPVGTNSSIKITSAFEILSNETTELQLDFDASQSVLEPVGLSTDWKLIPVIKLAKATH